MICGINTNQKQEVGWLHNMGRFSINPAPIIDVEAQELDDDWKYSSKVYKKYETYHGLNKDKVDELANVIAWTESEQKNIPQEGNYGGQGYFQMEDKTASNSFQVNLNRYENITGEAPKWLQEARLHDDPKLLEASQQAEVALVSIHAEFGSNDKLKAFLNNEPNAIREIWINHWWKDTKNKEKYDGTYETDAERDKRIDAKRIWFDKKYQKYLKKKKDPKFEDIIMDDMILSDDPLGMA